MAEERVQRKLTTIMAADVEGYSRLMSADEEATLKTLITYREIIDGLISRHGGRIFGAAGDSVVAEFGSAVEAVRCAIAIQEELRVRNAELVEDRRMRFRIGVNVGDVMVEGDNLFGDGVNVAARLESIAEAGGVCISGSAFDQVKNKLSIGFEDIGAQEVKNIPEPVPAFRVVPGQVSVAAGATPIVAKRWRVPAIAAAVVVMILAAGGVAWWQPWVPDVEPASIDKMAFKVSDGPSIAVLPFTNMSGDKEQEYFSDGITEDIITDLSKVSGLFVIARNSTFTYKGKAVKVRQIAKDLGVRYVLEGSVRRSGEALRITTQLIDGTTGSHIWAERYDRGTKNVFAIQDEIAAKVAAELAVTLKADEQERLFRRHTKNLEAYEIFLRARHRIGTKKKNLLRNKKRFERIIELDPKFAGGYAGLSNVYSRLARHGYSVSPKNDIDRSLSLARQAIEIDSTFGWSYIALGGAQLMKGMHDNAIETMTEALRIQPNDADAYGHLGFYLHWAGRGKEAIRAVKTGRRLTPRRKNRFRTYLGLSYFTAGQYEDAIDAILQNYETYARRGHVILNFLAASYVATGQDVKAREVMQVYLSKNPRHTISNHPLIRVYKRAEDRERFAGMLRKAGMPE